MKNRLLQSAALTLMVAFTPRVNATGSADPVNPQAGQPKIVRTNRLEVCLPITVKSGDRVVPGLTMQNLEIYEDGKRQEIERFIAPGFPLRIAILKDTNLPSFEESAIEDFVEGLNRNPRVELSQYFTNRTAGLYDDICRVIEKDLSTRDGPEAHPILVVMSETGRDADVRSLEDALERAQRYDVTVFVIDTKNFGLGEDVSVLSSTEREIGKLCEETGGQLFRPHDKLRLFRAFTDVAQTLRQEYVVFYVPQNQEKTGRIRSIQVKLIRAPGRAFHKKGYVY